MFYKSNTISLARSGISTASGAGLALLAAGLLSWSTSIAEAGPTPTPGQGVSASASGGSSSGLGVSATIGAPEPGGNLVGPGVTASVESNGPEFKGTDIIAHVGDMDVKAEDMRAIIATLEPSEQAAMAANPAMLKRVILSLLIERMVIKELAAKKWDEQPDVQAHLDRVRKTTLAEMYLKSVTQPPADYPGEEELRKTYEANKSSFTVPQQLRIAQIFIALPANADQTAGAKAVKKLEKVVDALKKPDADFAKIAHENSDETGSAAQGGEMGWIDQKQMPAKIRIEAMTLPRNTPSAPIKINDGWHIIKVLDAKDPAPIAFDEIKDKLAQTLRAQRTEANRRAYVVDLLKQTPVSLNDKALENVLKKTN